MHMKSLYLILGMFFTMQTAHAQPVKIMLITGGHAFDTVQFFQMFEQMQDVSFTHFGQPQANKTIANGEAEKYDVLVFYDMWKEIDQNEKSAYIELTKKGKPFLFLHHSLVSYQDWETFEKLIGGKYVSKNPDVPEEEYSNYEHDVWIYMQTARNHPVTKGFGTIKLFDEVYGNTKVSDNVIPLFTTTHPKSSRIIGWENKFNQSTIVYIQPGHDYRAFESEDYQKLLRQTILYLSETN